MIKYESGRIQLAVIELCEQRQTELIVQLNRRGNDESYAFVCQHFALTQILPIWNFRCNRWGIFALKYVEQLKNACILAILSLNNCMRMMLIWIKKGYDS